MSASRNGHERFMRRALELARRGEGLTRPNPPVGAVVVRRGRIVGEGYHRRAGGPHAEVIALRRAGRKARGATLYVTLEPCCTWGRTPPCADAVIAADVRAAVIAARDPNPRHAGRGLAILRRAGIRVVEGVCGPEALELLAPFGKWTTTGRPLVTLKLAMSLDGRIADRRGAARWISGRAARRFGQDVRRTADAILVGAGTVRADNPSLLPRPAHGRKPYRVIVVGRRRIPSGSRVLNDTDAERTILAVAGSRPRGLAAASRRGARVVRFGASRRVPLARLMKKLGAMGCLHVLCEGGGSLAESLVREGLVDRLLLIYAPCFIGGDGAPAGVRGSGWLIDRLPRVRIGSVERLGSDVLVRAEPLRR